MSADGKGRVLVIGAGGLDIVGRCLNPPMHGTSNPAVIRHSFGGVARNVAENLARLGQPVSLITAIGDDQAGRQLVEHAQAAGVDVAAVLCTEGCVTSTYLGVLDDAGELHIAADDMRVLDTLTPEHLQAHADLFRGAEMLFVDANLSPTTLRAAFSLARRTRVPVCVDPTSAALARRLKPFLARTHLFTGNAGEAGALTGVPIESGDEAAGLAAARQLVSLGVENALVTLGPLGVCYASSETSGNIPALRTNILDPTGAGNALTATVIFGLLNDMGLDESVRLGVSAATLTLRHPGTVYPDLSLERLYDELVI